MSPVLSIYARTCTKFHQVIIDNMMNLEVLFASANLTGNDTLRQIATSHADKTMQNHVRADGTYSVLSVFKILTDLRIGIVNI